MEKSTPPIGEPKATATPAALAAVKISRRLTSGEQDTTSRTYFGCSYISGIVLTRCYPHSTRHARWGPPCLLPVRIQSTRADGLAVKTASTHKSQSLDDKRLQSEISVDNEPAQNALDFRNTRARSVRSKVAYEICGSERKHTLLSACIGIAVLTAKIT